MIHNAIHGLTWMILALSLPAAAVAQTGAVWGTRPDEVMVAVYAQFDEESDERLWHLPLQAVAVHSSGALRIELREGPVLYLPVSEGDDAASLVREVEGSVGQLIRLEYHPTVDSQRGRIHASWTRSVSRLVAGEGHVPMTNVLYSALLRHLGDDVPNTGVFAPLAAAQRRLDLLHRNITAGNGREVDELAEDFRAAAEYAGLPLEFYKLPDGTHCTEKTITDIKNRGYVLSAVDYWNAAVSKFRQNRIVSPTLNDFATAWELVPESARVPVEFPGRGERILSDDLLHQFRRIAGQKYLDAAYSAAAGGDSEWTGEMLRRFSEERKASGLPMSDFQLQRRPAQEGDPEFLVKLARGETGFVGFFRAIWHRILAEAVPGAPPT